MNSESNLSACQIFERIVRSCKINSREYHQLSATILADEQINEEEHRQINRIFDAMQRGRLKVVDSI